jgi:hypothetical protein
MHVEHKVIIVLLVVVLAILVYNQYKVKQVAESFRFQATSADDTMGNCASLSASYCQNPPSNSIGQFASLRNIFTDCGKDYTLGKTNPSCGEKDWMNIRAEAPLDVVRKIAYPPLEYPQN